MLLYIEGSEWYSFILGASRESAKHRKAKDDCKKNGGNIVSTLGAT